MAVLFSELQTYARRRYLDKVDAQSTTVIKQAINDAIRMLAEKDHPYFTEQGYINVKAPQTTGTVAVAQNGTQVTLSGATWPADVVGQFLKLADDSIVHFEVGVRDSDTEVTFANSAQWVYDAVSAGSYVLYRDRYPWPSNFRSVGKVFDKFALEDVDWIDDPDEWYHIKIENYNVDGQPRWACIADSGLLLWPYQTVPQSVPYMYKRWPTEMASDSDEMDYPENEILAVYRAIDYQVAIARGKEEDEKLDTLKEQETRTARAARSPSGNVIRIGKAGRPIRFRPYSIGDDA
jgi:hypothetical protein